MVQVAALERELAQARQAQGSGGSGGGVGARFGLPSGVDVLGGLRGLGRWRDERQGLPKVGSAPNLDLESAGKKDLLEGRVGARCGTPSL